MEGVQGRFPSKNAISFNTVRMKISQPSPANVLMALLSAALLIGLFHFSLVIISLLSESFYSAH